MVIDDLKGLDNAIEKHFSCDIQKCVLHLKRNILGKAKKSHRTAMAAELAELFRVGKIDTYTDFLSRANTFYNKWKKYYSYLSVFNDEDKLRYYIVYLNYEEQIQSMIYTTNWIERLNKSFKRTLKIRNAMPSIESVLTLMSKVAIDMEETSYRYPVTRFAKSRLFVR